MSASGKVRRAGTWASPLDRWHDERGGIVHFCADGPAPWAPACGARVYASGQVTREATIPAHACKRCASIAQKAPRIWLTFGPDGTPGVLARSIRAARAAARRRDAAGLQGQWFALEEYYDGDILWSDRSRTNAVEAIRAFLARFDGTEDDRANALAFAVTTIPEDFR